MLVEPIAPCLPLADLAERVGYCEQAAGLVVEPRTVATKNGEEMAFVMLEDLVKGRPSYAYCRAPSGARGSSGRSARL